MHNIIVLILDNLYMYRKPNQMNQYQTTVYFLKNFQDLCAININPLVLGEIHY